MNPRPARSRTPAAEATLEALEPRTLMDSSLLSDPPVAFRTNKKLGEVVAADLNADGLIDLAFAAGMGINVAIRREAGGWDRRFYGVNSLFASDLIAVNLNGDEFSDLAFVSNYEEGGPIIRTLLGAASGLMGIGPNGPSGGIGGAGSFLPGDRQQLIVYSYNYSYEYADAALYGLENGETHLQMRSTSVRFDQPIGIPAPLIDDFTGDGLDDAVLAGRRLIEGDIEEGPWLFSSHGRDYFDEFSTFEVPAGFGIIHQDADGDGLGDLLFVSEVSSATPEKTLRIGVSHGLEGGGFAPTEWVYSEQYIQSFGPPRTGLSLRILGVADINGDGARDIVIHRVGESSWDIGTFSSSLLFLLDNGEQPGYTVVRGHYERNSPLGTSNNPLPAPRQQFRLADMDGDGVTDVLWSDARRLRIARCGPGNKGAIVGAVLHDPFTNAETHLLSVMATGVFDSDEVRGGFVDRVQFWLDSNGNGQRDAGDIVLGDGEADSADPHLWRFTFERPSTSGPLALLARARDDRGAWGRFFAFELPFAE